MTCIHVSECPTINYHHHTFKNLIISGRSAAITENGTPTPAIAAPYIEIAQRPNVMIWISQQIFLNIGLRCFSPKWQR